MGRASTILKKNQNSSAVWRNYTVKVDWSKKMKLLNYRMFSLWGILQNADVANKRAHSSKCKILFKKKNAAQHFSLSIQYSDFTWRWRNPLGLLKFMRSLVISFIMLTICTASFENGLDQKRWTDVVVIALPIVCAELWEWLLVIRYPGEVFNVLRYIDLQIFSCGLVSILSHKFTVDVLLFRQTTCALIELRARIDFLLNKTHFCLKYNK